MSEGIKHTKDVEAEVVADILQRQKMGIQKYGTSVATNPLELMKWFQHAYEEALDFAIYLKRIQMDLATVSMQPQSPEDIAKAIDKVLGAMQYQFPSK